MSYKIKETVNILDALKMVAPIFPAPMYWHDTKGIVLGINAQALERMCKSIEEVLGKTPYDFYPKEVADHIWENSIQVLKSGETLSQEEYAYDSSGKCIGTYLAIKTPLYDTHGHALGVLGTSIDITEIKEKGTALEQANAKLNILHKQFLEDQEHDIRTPLSGIMLATDFLLSKEIDNEKIEYLQAIKESAKELKEYNDSILQVLELDALENTRYNELINRRFEIQDVIAKIYKLCLPAIKNKNIDFSYKIEEAIPKFVLGDYRYLHRIILNLICNAIRFTIEGHIAIKVLLVKKFENKVIINFTIEDTGIGIPPEKQDTIFIAFSKLKPSNKGGERGRGLGLALVKKFVEIMNGELDLISEVGKGSKFSVVLPFDISLMQD